MAEVFPELKHFYSGFAIDESSITWRNTPSVLHGTPIIMGLLYVTMVWYLPGWLLKNKHTKLAPLVKPYMMAWNLFLSVLSGGMFLGIAIPYFNYYWAFGLWDVVCDEPQRFSVPGVNVVWIALFGYSKFFELVDTFFLIMKNPERPVAFLNWYHHVTVMWFTWYASNWRLSVGMAFASMNSIVHMFMYWYYYQTERGIYPSWAKLLTIGQISQMVVGLGMNIAWAWGYTNGYGCSCDRSDVILVMGLVMYASYLFLFLKFFVERYVLSSKKGGGGGQEDSKKKEEAGASKNVEGTTKNTKTEEKKQR